VNDPYGPETRSWSEPPHDSSSSKTHRAVSRRRMAPEVSGAKLETISHLITMAGWMNQPQQDAIECLEILSSRFGNATPQGTNLTFRAIRARLRSSPSQNSDVQNSTSSARKRWCAICRRRCSPRNPPPMHGYARAIASLQFCTVQISSVFTTSSTAASRSTSS